MSLTRPYKELDLLEHSFLDVSDLGLRIICLYPVEFMNINVNTITYSYDSDLPLSLAWWQHMAQQTVASAGEVSAGKTTVFLTSGMWCS